MTIETQRTTKKTTDAVTSHTPSKKESLNITKLQKWLLSHLTKVMLKVTKNRLSTTSGDLPVEKEAWRTVKNIVNCHILKLNEKSTISITSLQLTLKPFSRVRLRQMMQKFSIGERPGRNLHKQKTVRGAIADIWLVAKKDEYIVSDAHAPTSADAKETTTTGNVG